MITLLLVSAALVTACVIFHGLALAGLARLLFDVTKFSFWRVSVFIFAAILAHLIEILFFTLAFARLVPDRDFGSIAGVEQPGWDDLFYFSAATYTATGYGDLTPVGNLRIFATIEALTGLIMIAWTASFAFFVMQRYWQNQPVAATKTAQASVSGSD
jgi:hypothetical protein